MQHEPRRDRRSTNTQGERWYVYALFAPHGRTPKYVGSTFEIAQRLDRHRSNRLSSVRAWLLDLDRAGKQPRTEELAIFYDRDSARDFEGRVIRGLRVCGVPLLNSTAPRESAYSTAAYEQDSHGVPAARRVDGGPKLLTWLDGRTQRWFSQKTGIGQQLMSAYCNQLARPLPMSVNALRIQTATDGGVTVFDWMLPSERAEYSATDESAPAEVG